MEATEHGFRIPHVLNRKGPPLRQRVSVKYPWYFRFSDLHGRVFFQVMVYWDLSPWMWMPICPWNMLSFLYMLSLYIFASMFVLFFIRLLSLYIRIYTGCPRRNEPDFGRVFLMLNYTDITQNTYVQSRTVTEIIAREKCGLHRSRRTVRSPWRHTCPMRLPDNETL